MLKCKTNSTSTSEYSAFNPKIIRQPYSLEYRFVDFKVKCKTRLQSLCFKERSRTVGKIKVYPIIVDYMVGRHMEAWTALKGQSEYSTILTAFYESLESLLMSLMLTRYQRHMRGSFITLCDRYYNYVLPLAERIGRLLILVFAIHESRFDLLLDGT